jgi:hypothetical protein
LREITVTGSVSSDRKPLSGINVRFTSAASDIQRDQIDVTTDPDGHYTAALPGPGEYVAELIESDVPLFGQDRPISVGVSPYVVDWDLPAIGIDVSVTGWSNRYPLDVVFAQASSGRSGVASAGAVIRPGQVPAVTLHGMAADRYSICAKEEREDRAIVSAEETVELSVASGIATSQLTLQAYDGNLRVLDEARAPITNATVITMDGNTLVPEAVPGLYRLGQSRPGVRMLIVAPGHVPQCVHSTQSANQTVILDKGYGVTLSYESRRPVDASVPIGRLWWEGTECPVSLSRFDYHLAPLMAINRSCDSRSPTFLARRKCGSWGRLLVRPFAPSLAIQPAV